MWFNDDEYEDDNGQNTNSSNSPSGQTTNPGNANISQSASVSLSGVSQTQVNIANSSNSPTSSQIPNVSSPTGKLHILIRNRHNKTELQEMLNTVVYLVSYYILILLGGSPILAGSNNVGITSAVSLAAAAAVAACGAAATSPLAAAAAVAASAGATVGFSAVVDGVVSANSDKNTLIHQSLEGQTILPNIGKQM